MIFIFVRNENRGLYHHVHHNDMVILDGESHALHVRVGVVHYSSEGDI